MAGRSQLKVQAVDEPANPVRTEVLKTNMNDDEQLTPFINRAVCA